MYCPKCGRETESGGKFCQWCGADTRIAPPRAVLRKKVGDFSTEKFAGLGRRVASGFIDILFLILFDLIVVGTLSIIFWLFQRPSPISESIVMLYQYYRHVPRTDAYGNMVTAAIPSQIVLSAGILFLLVPWFYFSYLESSRNQATLGKLVVRIAVTDMQGSRITFARATLRFFAMSLSFLTLCIGFLIPAFTRYKQGLHDMIAGTLIFRQDL
ncbi:MAG: RDD family protein [Methanolinea sp.]|jgi:uncharacterized RDD family membrane protein YckC|nr:RDD family protein [Methanolinea sp.]